MAKGYTQQSSINYLDYFYPVTKVTIIQTLLVVIAVKKTNVSSTRY